MTTEPFGIKTYQVRLYVAGVHTLECQATSPEHARGFAEALWWTRRRGAFHIDDVLQAAPDVVAIDEGATA